jgi:Uma2 family endonuclease
LTNADKVELIDGFLVSKMPKSPEHGYSTKKIITSIEGLLPAGWIWRAEQPVRIPEFDEPEPDVAIVRGTDETYRHQLPGPSDVALVVEISLTTVGQDRGKKLEAYSRVGIPVYWIVNLEVGQIEVYTAPLQARYQLREDYKPGQSVPVIIAGNQVGQIAVAVILP